MITAVDLFAGAGGTSTGLAQAAELLGCRLRLVAVNHWDRAVETHAANHPWAEHLCAGIDSIDPRKVVPWKLDLLVASPECTHHSIARGGRPMCDQSRASAWCVVRWAEALRPRCVLVENVREFQSWGPLTTRGRPMKSRGGETYQAWLQALRSLGYSVAARVLCCADYGDPTTRRRLFVLAWRGRRAAPWPAQTHVEVRPGDLPFASREPWRPAREIIDWSIPSPSIFGRRRPLKPATMARIIEGLRRFGGPAAEPFGEIGLIEPFVLQQQSGGVPRRTSEPLPTIASAGAISLVEPFIVPFYGEKNGHPPRPRSVRRPMPTVAGTRTMGLAEPFLVRYQGTGGPESIERPVSTVTARDRLGLVEPTTQLDIHFRMLQPHELAAAQGFPAGYDFRGNRTEIIRQIGNAVPVGTARALCATLLREEAERDREIEDFRTGAVGRRGWTLRASRSAAATRRPEDPGGAMAARRAVDPCTSRTSRP